MLNFDQLIRTLLFSHGISATRWNNTVKRLDELCTSFKAEFVGKPVLTKEFIDPLEVIRKDGEATSLLVEKILMQ